MAVWCGAPERQCDGSASSKPEVPEEAKDSVPLSPQSGSRNVKEDKDGPPGVGWMGWMDCMGWVFVGQFEDFLPMIWGCVEMVR